MARRRGRRGRHEGVSNVPRYTASDRDVRRRWACLPVIVLAAGWPAFAALLSWRGLA